MNYFEKIEMIMENHHGTVIGSDLDKHEIPRVYLDSMDKEGKVKRVHRGVYVRNDSLADEMYALQRKYKYWIFSHDTALFIHGLLDSEPSKYSVTAPARYRVDTGTAEKVNAYSIKDEYHEMGLENIISSFGNPIRVYNIERTICDLIKFRKRMDVHLINSALKRLLELETIDYSLLLQYGKKLRIESVLDKNLNNIVTGNTDSIINSIIPISRFNMDKASKVFNEISKSGAKVIVKNNKPEFVLITQERYNEMMKIIENYYLLVDVEKRVET